MALEAVTDRDERFREGDDADVSPVVALNAFLAAIARHRLVFAAVVASCLLGGVMWLAHRTPTYRSTAAILVSPIPEGDESLFGLPLIRASALDAQRPAETATSLLQSPAAAGLAAARLHGGSPGSVSSSVEVSVIAGSSLVQVAAEADSPEEAAAIANAYAGAALRVKDRRLAPEVEAEIQSAEGQLSRVADPNGREANALEERLADLRSISRTGDPTLSLGRSASPGAPQDLPALQVVLIALVAGLLLASLTVVMIELLTARPVRIEAELERLYPLPVLARAPRVPRSMLATATDGVREVPEGYRALRDQLELRAADGRARGPGAGSAVLMVSPGRDDRSAGGALTLARAFAAVHATVALVELDVRNPRLAAALGVDPAADLSALLDGGPVESAATPFDSGDSWLFPAPPATDFETREAIFSRTGEILGEVGRMRDWTVVDVPSGAEAPADVIAALDATDRVVVVVQLGSTRPEQLSALRDLFEQRGRTPDGYLVVSDDRARGR